MMPSGKIDKYYPFNYLSFIKVITSNLNYLYTLWLQLLYNMLLFIKLPTIFNIIYIILNFITLKYLRSNVIWYILIYKSNNTL